MKCPSCLVNTRVMWMAEERIHIKMVGKRPRGRPRIRWIDHIINDIKMRGENWEEIKKT